MGRNRRHAPPPHPDTEEIRRKNREEARKSAPPPRNVEEIRRRNREAARNCAEPPPRNVEEIRRRNREDARSSATPGQSPQRDECCGKSLFRVTSGRVVHGAKKGDVVELCESGATRALVQAGHLVPVEPEPESEAATVTADTEKEANDG